ncbi:LysR family substrate-binding domain-containing protein [Streptomyces sp. PTM05]|uniref:LysR family substrate-binding domain-containing protein n=1 Tax=Streptantibioticus parmotrematis TaxID=2873249 RepID=A0ABS7QPQ7_9ACTN|nr:LysR family substrate-binding domain-containing protein [Streptantibioticus parmotrematis]MBY8885171.1 LysR family substrate-binding domain-containing protein [Streptantibioticus parmotrematis]
MTDSETAPSFRLGYVPGVTPGKWVRIWQERLPDVPLDLVAVTSVEAPDAVRRAEVDAALLRVPSDRAGLSVIPLYTETTVVVIPKDHLVAAADEVTAEDLADEVVFHPLDETLEWDRRPGRPAVERPATTADAVELVAAGVGVLVAPQSLARLHHRRDLTYRTVTDAPQSRVGLSWPEGETTDMVDDFIGIVRGRTANSTRGRRAAAQPETKRTGTATGATKKSGSEKAGAAKKSGDARRGRASGTSGGSHGKAVRNRTGGTKGGAQSGRRGKPRRRS